MTNLDKYFAERLLNDKFLIIKSLITHSILQTSPVRLDTIIGRSESLIVDKFKSIKFFDKNLLKCDLLQESFTAAAPLGYTNYDCWGDLKKIIDNVREQEKICLGLPYTTEDEVRYLIGQVTIIKERLNYVNILKEKNDSDQKEKLRTLLVNVNDKKLDLDKLILFLQTELIPSLQDFYRYEELVNKKQTLLKQSLTEFNNTIKPRIDSIDFDCINQEDYKVIMESINKLLPKHGTINPPQNSDPFADFRKNLNKISSNNRIAGLILLGTLFIGVGLAILLSGFGAGVFAGLAVALSIKLSLSVAVVDFALKCIGTVLAFSTAIVTTMGATGLSKKLSVVHNLENLIKEQQKAPEISSLQPKP